MAEAIPLMASQRAGDRKQLTVRQDATAWTPVTIEESAEEDKMLFAESKSRTTSLVISDMWILLCQLLQVYCLLHAMALRWTWPEPWLFYTRPILLVNLDVWTLVKLSANGTYSSLQGAHIPSDEMPFPFWVVLVVWGVVLVVGVVVYVAVYVALRSAHHPYMFLRVARLQRVYVVMLQLLALPYGTCVAHVFHCDADGYVDVDNSLRCHQGQHWAYMGVVLVVSLPLYLVLPVWMVVRARGEMLSMGAERHEAYLQLKETEYVHGMDTSWVVGHFHVFGSFTKYGAYYRPCMHWLALVLVGLYAGLHDYLDIQAMCVAGALGCVFLGLLVVRPFRVMCFNVFLVLSWLFLTVDGLLGALLASHKASAVDSVWLLPDYMLRLLAGLNGVWVVVILFFVVFVLARHCRCCCRAASCCRQPLWPQLSSNRIHKLSPHTHKYVKAILRGRMLIDQILKMSPLFAPAHELGRQIHIVNAYVREAEILRDPMENSLWDLLDQLIEIHGQVAPKSLFAESVKDSIRTTAADLMRMMPAFSRRLAQREYDFLLMLPVKRRMLLKMYCMGLFLNQRRETQAKQRLTVPYLQKVWKQKQHATQIEELPDDGYYEDMYPAQEQTPGDVFQDETLVTMDLMVLDDKEIDDEVVLEEAENWAKDHPIPALETPGYTYTNLVFEDDSDMESTATEQGSTSSEEEVGDNESVIQEIQSHDSLCVEDETSPVLSPVLSPDQGQPMGGEEDRRAVSRLVPVMEDPEPIVGLVGQEGSHQSAGNQTQSRAGSQARVIAVAEADEGESASRGASPLQAASPIAGDPSPPHTQGEPAQEEVADFAV